MSCRVLAVCALVALAGCHPATKYEWGGYPNGLLAYYRTPTERANFDKVLTETLDSAEAKGKVPPGLYAEAGYEAMSQGDTERAGQLFEKEEAAWPESVFFMNKALANLHATKPQAVPNATPTPAS
jgi:hypothetical protein